MDEKRIFEKLEKIEEHIGVQAVTLGKLTVSVEEHVRRTNLLEEEIKPVKRHVSMMEGALKLIGVLGVVAGIIEAFMLVKR